MKALTRAQQERLAALQADLTESAERVESAYADLTDRITAAWDATVAPVVAAHNAYVEAFNEFRTEVCDAIEEYVSERSEAWQDTDRGQAFASWLESWQTDLDPLSVEPPEVPDAPECPHADDYPTDPG